MIVLDLLMFLAKGGKPNYQHKNGKENKNTTNLQNLLDDCNKRR